MSALVAWVRNPITVRVCQLAIGFIFAWAGLAKIGDLGAFALQVHNFRLLPVPVEHLAAMTMPWIEVFAGLALVLGIHARAGGFVTAGMMAVFTLAVLAALARGLDIECGCFGTADASRVGLVKVLQNLGMLALAVIASLRTAASPRV